MEIGRHDTEIDIDEDEYHLVSSNDNETDDFTFPLLDSLASTSHGMNEGDDMLELLDSEFEEFITGRLSETEATRLGNTPASHEALQNLVVSVVVSKEDVEMGNNVICAVCKNDMIVGEKARELPCRHRYHGDCILPWLRMRNTCPVCHFQLTTDDPNEENRGGG